MYVLGSNSLSNGSGKGFFRVLVVMCEDIVSCDSVKVCNDCTNVVFFTISLM